MNKEQLMLTIGTFGFELHNAVASPTGLSPKVFWGRAALKVKLLHAGDINQCTVSIVESRSLEVERKMGGNFHLKLNIGLRPIANKYHEGNVKRTLKRKLKVPEIAGMKANEMSEHK